MSLTYRTAENSLAEIPRVKMLRLQSGKRALSSNMNESNCSNTHVDYRHGAVRLDMDCRYWHAATGIPKNLITRGSSRHLSTLEQPYTLFDQMSFFKFHDCRLRRLMPFESTINGSCRSPVCKGAQRT
jgi:hypothetical protein